MMVFLFKASLIIGVFLVFYKLFLEKETFFASHRVYLLACLILTFVIPYVSLPGLIKEQGFISETIGRLDTSSSTHVQETITTENRSLESMFNNVGHAPEVRNQSPENKIKDFRYWLSLIYYFGVMVLALNFIAQIIGILTKLARSTDKIRDTDCIIVNNVTVKEPCSFFNYIFINPEKYEHETYEQILAHEKIHVMKWHTIDLLLGEIAVIFLWFNPFAWLFRKEIEKNLEYQTDSLLLSGDTVMPEKYQMSLLKIATYNKPMTVTTNYNQSLIKQRILKMNSKKSNSYKYWKYAFIAPLLFIMLLSMNKPLDGISPNGKGFFGSPLKSDRSCKALLSAVKGQNVVKVKELLKTTHPDCIYEDDGEPRTPLVAAARKGNLEIGKLLVGAKADIEFHYHADESPLMAAAANGHLEFVTYLMKEGAKVNRKVQGDGTALLVASREGHLEIVEYLIAKGADVNGQVGGDGTPLINSVRRQHYEISRILLEKGADPHLASPGDEYPMFHARMLDDKRMIVLLKEYERDN